MRHAFLILAHNNTRLLEELIIRLKDKHFFLYIHVDKKSNIDYSYLFLKYKSKNVFFLKRNNINWGNFNIIKQTIKLIEVSKKNKYDYYHLISGDTLPIKSNDYIKNFFEKNKGYQFFEIFDTLDDIPWRLGKYHVCGDYHRCRNKFLRKIYRFVNICFKIIPRKKPKNLEKFYHGYQWCSFDINFANYVISNKKWIDKTFKFTHCGDEIFLTTLIKNSCFASKTKKGLMYIDRDDIFDQHSMPPLLDRRYKKILENSDKLFARKFCNDYKFLND